MTTTKKRPPLFNLEDLQRSREQDQTAYRILADCDRRAGVWTGQPVTQREETQGDKRTERPGEAVHGQVGTHWPHYIACDFELIEWKTPRCKSCGDPREDNLRGCEDYPETICDECAFVLALARIRQAMAMARMREQPPCPWIASLKADEV